MDWEDTLWCDGCGVEIIGPPVQVGNQQFCCRDCSQGLECTCLGLLEQDEDRRSSGLAAVSAAEDLSPG